MLTLGQQYITSPAWSGPIERHFPATTCSKWDNQTLDPALKQAKKDVFTPDLALLIWYECPFTLGHYVYSGCLLDLTEFQPKRALSNSNPNG